MRAVLFPRPASPSANQRYNRLLISRRFCIPVRQFRRQPVRVKPHAPGRLSPRGSGDSRSSPPARGFSCRSDLRHCGSFPSCPEIDLPESGLLPTRRAPSSSAPSRPLLPDGGRAAFLRRAPALRRRPDDRLLLPPPVTRRASSSVGASFAPSSTPSTSAGVNIRRLHSASSMASSACGFAAIRSAPASFRLSTERNPQLTAQQATPALRAVSTSTSESPMYTVSSLVTPI